MEILTSESFGRLCDYCCKYKTKCAVVVSTREDAYRFMREVTSRDEAIKERFGIRRYLRTGIEFINDSLIVVLSANMAELRGHRFEKVLCSVDCVRHADLETLIYLPCLERSGTVYWTNSALANRHEPPANTDSDLGELESADISILFG